MRVSKACEIASFGRLRNFFARNELTGQYSDYYNYRSSRILLLAIVINLEESQSFNTGFKSRYTVYNVVAIATKERHDVAMVSLRTSFSMRRYIMLKKWLINLSHNSQNFITLCLATQSLCLEKKLCL